MTYRKEMTPIAGSHLSCNLDILRASAVLSVLLFHLSFPLGYRWLVPLGRLGVVIFFVHTSLVLMGSLQRLEKSAVSDTRLIIGFWIRRFFRIYPLAILVVLLAVMFHIPVVPGEPYHWMGSKAFVFNLMLIQNLTGSQYIQSPMWTLPLEVQMYAMLPFAYLFVRGNRRYRSVWLWILSVLVASSVSQFNERLSVFLFAPCFISGVVAYDVIRSRRSKLNLPAWTWPAAILLILAFFGHGSRRGFEIHLYWILSLALGLLYANTKEGSWGKMQDVFHWIAEHSYGIYLSHYALIWIVYYKMTAVPKWIRLSVLIAELIVVPALLYILVERPLIRLGGRIASRVIRQRDNREIHQLA